MGGCIQASLSLTELSINCILESIYTSEERHKSHQIADKFILPPQNISEQTDRRLCALQTEALIMLKVQMRPKMTSVKPAKLIIHYFMLLHGKNYFFDHAQKYKKREDDLLKA